MQNLLSNAKEDYLVVLKRAAATLKGYMDSCDESKADDANCVYDTLWSELDGHNTSIFALDGTFTKYTKRAKAEDNKLTAATKNTA